jgi:anti-anti-sigma factor
VGFSRNTQFAVQLDRRNGVARLALRGELDQATAPILDGQLSLADGDGVSAVLLDLRELTFMDSTGLRAVIRAHSNTREKGLRLAIVGASDAVRKVFQITRTDHILDGDGSVDLLAAFTRPPEASAHRRARR